jgi:hypothetical protein
VIGEGDLDPDREKDLEFFNWRSTEKKYRMVEKLSSLL